MAVSWIIWALDEEMVDWLRSQSIEVPGTPSRFPTIGEIRRALDQPDLRVRISDGGPNRFWEAFIENGTDEDRRWAILDVSDYTGEDAPLKPRFEKGDETLIRQFVKRLTADTGPLVLLADAGDPPEVIVQD